MITMPAKKMLAGLFCGKAQNSPNGKNYLLDIIKGAKIPPNMQPDQSNTNVTTCSFNKEEQQAISDELNSLLAKGNSQTCFTLPGRDYFTYICWYQKRWKL